MKRHWRKIADIDEHVPISPTDAKAILSTFEDEEGKPRKNPLWVYLVPGIPPMALLLPCMFLVSTQGWSPWTFVPVVAASLGYFILAQQWVVKRYLGRKIRVETHKRGYDICIDCGYWLRGLPEGVARCPECGAAVKPVGTTDGHE